MYVINYSGGTQSSCLDSYQLINTLIVDWIYYRTLVLDFRILWVVSMMIHLFYRSLRKDEDRKDSEIFKETALEMDSI